MDEKKPFERGLLIDRLQVSNVHMGFKPPNPERDDALEAQIAELRAELGIEAPLLYAPEKEIAAFAKEAELPVVPSSCPADENTQREEMKQLLRDLERSNKGLRHRIFGAIQRGEIDGFHLPDRRPLVFPEPTDTEDNPS